MIEKAIFRPTSPAGAVAKYCDVHVYMCVCVCVSICLSVCVSDCPRAYLRTNFSVYVAYASVCHASANRIRKILSAGDAAYRPGRGDGSAQRGRHIYDCIVIF